jgi:hypothetical protein
MGAVLSSGILVTLDSGSFMSYSFGTATLAAQAWLFSSALYFRAKSTARFDMTVAAETIVALGVFSLITGIVVAVAATPRAHITMGNSTLREFEPLLIPFGEGLLASAVAPLLATILRQIEVLNYGPLPGADSTTDELDLLRQQTDRAAKALSQIAVEADCAGKNVAAFAEAARSVVDRLYSVATYIEDTRSRIPDALSAVASGIGGSGAGVAAALGASAEHIRASGDQVPTSLAETADKIRAGGDEVSEALSQTSSALDGLVGEANSSAVAAHGMGAEFDKLSAEARATTGILTRLQQLIDTVTDFIRPEKV